MTKRKQLNVRLAPKTCNRVRVDRDNGGRTNDIVVEVALEAFFSNYTPEQRLKFYRTHFHTPYSRA